MTIESNDEEEKPRGLFDIFKSLSQTKDSIDSDIENYNAFMMNRCFAKYPDTIFLANEMDKFSAYLSSEIQRDFYLYAVNSKARFAKWYKPIPPLETINYLISSLEISREEALVYLDLFSEEEKKNLLPKKGGLIEGEKKKNKRQTKSTK